MKFNSRFGGTRRGGVAFRLFIGIALLSAIPALIIGYFSYSEGSREIIGEKVSDMRQISRLRLGVVSDMVEKLRAYALRFSESRSVAELSGVQAYENFPENITERLNANGFRAAAILGLSGNLLAASDVATYNFFTKTQWKALSVGKTFERAAGGEQLAVSEMSLDTPSGRRGMNFSLPVKNKDGKVSAVAVLYLDITRIQESVAAEAKNFTTSELFICSYVGGSPFIIAGANADGPMEPAFMGILAKTLEGAKISPDFKDSGYSLARDYRGKEVVAAWDYIPQLDWYVIMKTDLSEVLSGVRSLAYRIVLILIVVLALATAACAVFAKAFSAPISSILRKVSGFAPADGLWEMPKSDSQMIAASIDSIKDSLDTLASKSYNGASEILKGAERLSSDVSSRSEISRRIENFSDKIILHSQKISDMSVNLEHSVEQIDDVSEISVRQAENALGGLEKMNKLMSGLEACASDFSDSLGEIFASGRKIGAMVESMTQLADRANLLSLNASIAAKKAGKSGEGFAVVAERLRKLADQTSTATLEIENIVKGISSLSEAGSKKVGEFDSKFSEVSAQSKKVNEGLSEIIQKVQGIPPRLTLLLDGIRTQSGEGDSIKSYARALKKAVDDESKLMDSAREISDNLSKTALSVRREAGKHRI
ncbi:MAG TPA: methyl-accepting chemotaxis protein [Candidatus Merdousia gallistercoris]|nr:methyl-accepting chemotaxis protein [Candidatus Merdousia gallistercoris]